MVEESTCPFRHELGIAKREVMRQRVFLVKVAASVVAAIVLSTGCVNKKMMEFTYQELDTVKTRQDEILERLDMLTRQLEDERDGRVRSQAESDQTLREISEVLEQLGYRLDDTEQFLSRRPDNATRPTPRPPAGYGSGNTTPADSSMLQPPTSSDNESDKLFKGSYMDLTLGDYDLAVQGFKNYLVRYPETRNTASAHYYLGESYNALERYLEAVAEYQFVIRDYPDSRLNPPSYLKSGYCYQKLNESNLADKAFRELIARHPRSEEAEQARVALQEVGG